MKWRLNLAAALSLCLIQQSRQAEDRGDIRRRTGATRDTGVQGCYRGICTDKKENNIFLLYKEIQMGAVAKSYMMRGVLLYEEMRKYLVILEEAVSTRIE